MMDRAGALLASVFGFPDFRPGQAEVVAAVAAGRDTLAIMPTGGGKSLCFQLPALLNDGVTLVISPLIALMRDQVRALGELGVAAGALTSASSEADSAGVFDALRDGRLKLLYMAPERLALSGTLAMLRRAGVRRIAVDEAHCVSQWGHDFRPDYLRIGEVRQTLDVPLAAFTATADAETRTEIIERLFGGRTPEVFLRGFDRPNIRLCFRVKDQPRRQLLDYAASRRGQGGIVYAATRARSETLAGALRDAGHPACHYHAGMDATDRRETEARFQREDGLVVVATVAFGMGIDKPDIRWVAHADLPKSIESYYQEIGRAGRDGAPADTLTLYGPDDVRLRRAQIDEGAAPADRKMADHARLNALLGLAEAVSCRRQRLLAYFGEDSPPCGTCDLCETPPEVYDATDPVRMALSAMLRTGESYGGQHLTDILRGTATDRVRARRHDQLPTFGVGRGLAVSDWQSVFRQMMGRDLIRPDSARQGAYVMTEAAHPVLRGDERIVFRREGPRRKPATVVRALVPEDDVPLLSALKARRRALADAAGLPPYIIFTDRTLAEMAQARPATLDELAGISGVGAYKLERYGAAFLEVLTGEAVRSHPARMKSAGTPAGALIDRLAEAQARLARGEDGAGKLMSCPVPVLRRIAEARPRDLSALSRVSGLDGTRLDRFGATFLDIIAEA